MHQQARSIRCPANNRRSAALAPSPQPRPAATRQALPPCQETGRKCLDTKSQLKGRLTAQRRAASRPLDPQPRSGAMLVLIQVSSMNTKRFGSRRSCKLRQRCRRRAASARGPAQGRIVFVLKLRPSRRRKVHTAWCETFTPRAASSSFSPCSVKCGVRLILSTMNA
jgi:hypothetical protein